ncbi:MAG: TolC family protein [Gemmataceae bacterium]
MDALFGKECQGFLILAFISFLAPFASCQERLPPSARLAAPVTPKRVRLRNLVSLGLQHSPELQQARFAVKAAQGKSLQAGLYPNPTLTGDFVELGDRLGTGGINAFPIISQEIVTARKLKLDRKIADGTVNQVTLRITDQTFSLVVRIRRKFFEYLTLQQKLTVLSELRDLASASYRLAQQLEKAQQIAKLDVLQFAVAKNQLVARYEATVEQRTAVWRELVATVGVPNLPVAEVGGSLEYPLPEYRLDVAQKIVMHRHPRVLAAHVAVTKAEIALRRAEVEKIPNVTVSAGYIRQNQNKSDDWMLGVNVPLPLFDRNQGNILAAQAILSQAHLEVNRRQNELARQIAQAFGKYQSAKKRAELYQKDILQDAREAYKLAVAGFRGGEFAYLRVLAAQRTVAEARLEYLEARSKAWQAASEISGLLLEPHWPPTAISK